jgi:hypothetical protein
MRPAGVFIDGEPHSKRAKAAGRSGGFQEGGEEELGLSGRQLPQHMNEPKFVHGGSVATKLSVQRVDVHAHSFALCQPDHQGVGRCVVVR